MSTSINPGTAPLPGAATTVTALQALVHLCTDEGLAPENTVFICEHGSCAGSAPALPGYVWQDLHGCALPMAEGIKLARPELDVFVITSDAACGGAGVGHWIHALHHNMNLTVIVQGEPVGALARKPVGASRTSAMDGAPVAPINPLALSLGVPGASFVAQAVDWIPELLHDIVQAAFLHRGLSVVRVLHRDAQASPASFDPWLHDPQRSLLLTHTDGLQPRQALSGIYRNQRVHDPADIGLARAVAAQPDPMPVGILYRNPAAPSGADAHRADALRTPEFIRAGLARELDRLTVWPEGEPA